MNKIMGIYLAAGTSRRMGKNKLALPLGESCLGSIALETILQTQLDYTIVVTNPNDDLNWIQSPLIDMKNCCYVRCLDSEKGQSQSLRFGLKKAMQNDADAVMILLADQPFITIEIINKLIHLYRKCEKDFVAASFNGITRPPIIFSKGLYPFLLQLEGDRGARQIIREEIKDRGTIIEFTEGKNFFDIDSEANYELAKRLHKRRETI